MAFPHHPCTAQDDGKGEDAGYEEEFFQYLFPEY
jgi:hypothetical protein